MGVGYPEDLVVCVALGADMFDCVWPTRTARFGNAITSAGTINLRNAKYTADFSPIDDECECRCCKELGITRAYINSVASKETTGAHLLTIHNVHFQLALMGRARQAIIDERFPEFVKYFFWKWCREDKSSYPSWAITALKNVGIDLLVD